MRRAALLAALVLPAAACASPKSYPIRELASGSSSGLSVSTQRAFRTPAEYERFAAGLQGKGDFPSRLAGVEWDRELVIAAFGGATEGGEQVRFVRAGELEGALLVVVRKERASSASPFVGEPPPEPAEQAPAAPSTPFIVAAIPRYDGAVRFLVSRALFE
jgi:hypothetical protein